MKRAIVMVMTLAVSGALAGCGARNDIRPKKGESLPVAPYGAKAPPPAQDLLKPSTQARPSRSDELLKTSENRRSDDFDLPPPN